MDVVAAAAATSRISKCLKPAANRVGSQSSKVTLLRRYWGSVGGTEAGDREDRVLRRRPVT